MPDMTKVTLLVLLAASWMGIAGLCMQHKVDVMRLASVEEQLADQRRVIVTMERYLDQQERLIGAYKKTLRSMVVGLGLDRWPMMAALGQPEQGVGGPDDGASDDYYRN